VGREDVLREIGQDFETAAEWLLFYEDRKKQYFSDLNYIQDERSMPEVYVRTGAGNVVMQKVVRLAELERAEKWLLTIELVESMLGPKKRTFLDVRREARQKNMTVNGHEVWRVYVQRHYAERMAELNNSSMIDRWWISDQTLTSWWKEIVGLTRILAYKRGCF